MAKKQQKKGKLQQALVLFHYILQHFGCKDLEALSRDLKDPMFEGVNEDGESKLYHKLLGKLYATGTLTTERLYFYDQHVVQFTNEINEKRSEPIRWKYFHYLSLLFTEIYLDEYFTDAQALCNRLNAFLHDDFNHRAETWHELPDFTVDDLNKLAYWNATGSGKTLLMHINIKQYLYYAELHHAKKINRIIVLTPNEGLSQQHLSELHASHIEASLFSKQGIGSMFQGKAVEVIDINKLADKDGDKTVAVESFEGNNLVLVDEGHKGASGDVWMKYRKKLTEEGFSFEYSATFGQAISAKSNATQRKEMFNQYGKATLFDYSYRYFYADGYGKDYRIMNMDDWNNDELLNMYLTAYLMCLYEQIKIYGSDAKIHNTFLVEKPLGIFVGSSVNAISTENKRKVSDVAQVLLFLQDFIKERKTYATYIRRLLSAEDGLKTKNGYSVFGNSFQELKHGYLVEDDKQKFADAIYDGILSALFHSKISGAQLHIDIQKGGAEEIGLRVGNAPYFGVISVGDAKELGKLLQTAGFLCEVKAFGTASLFATINSQDSTINILIGSKKFTEGWSSWRVSAMGLMNVGRSEGSEVIQLFGRGVRLKGYKYSLKRSKMLDACYQETTIPKGLSAIETLNIFGVRADYMEAFKSYLEDEGLPTNEIDYEKIVIPTMPTVDFNQAYLSLPRVTDGFNFKKTAVVEPADEALCKRVKVKLDKYPKVDLLRSKNVGTSYTANFHIGTLSAEHLELIDWTEVYFALQKMKAERGWYNMELRIEDLKYLMANPSWYELAIPEADLDFRDYGKNMMMWQDITISLLRGYIDQSYKKAKAREEQKHLQESRVTYYNIGTPNEYVVEVRNDLCGIVDNLNILREQVENHSFIHDMPLCEPSFMALNVESHLYKPLLYMAEKDSNGRKPFVDDVTGEPMVKVSPVSLNMGERDFACRFREYCRQHQGDVLAGKEIYLLRNESKKGLGFFEANNFYPDFILWVLEGEKQYVTFIDPKGIRNLKGLNDPKIELYKYLQKEVAEQLNNPNLILNSFIISNTAMQQVEFWAKEPFAAKEFTDNHVLFKDDVNYMDKLIKMILH